jgi:myosin-crossreactive antigen
MSVARPDQCFVIRGGGETENHFECLWESVPVHPVS